MQIVQDDLSGTAIAALLRAHLDNMHAITPPGSVHALDLNALRSPTITFWSAWADEELLGCGALKALGTGCGEVKSMRTAEAHRGKGVASALLAHLIDVARQRRYAWLGLETGAMAAFEPARALYLARGFSYRGPFADYTSDPNSVFMEKRL